MRIDLPATLTATYEEDYSGSWYGEPVVTILVSFGREEIANLPVPESISKDVYSDEDKEAAAAEVVAPYLRRLFNSD